MTTFWDARAFLLKHRSDYDAAVKGFRWPDPVPFNWALDWFDAELARNPESRDRPALWIIDAGSNRETKLSFAALSRRSNQVANFLRAQGLKRGDHLIRIVVGGSTRHEGWLAYEQAADFPEDFTPDGPTGADDPMLLYFTSGTTAKPKLVRHSQPRYPVGGRSPV